MFFMAFLSHYYYKFILKNGLKTAEKHIIFFFLIFYLFLFSPLYKDETIEIEMLYK